LCTSGKKAGVVRDKPVEARLWRCASALRLVRDNPLGAAHRRAEEAKYSVLSLYSETSMILTAFVSPTKNGHNVKFS